MMPDGTPVSIRQFANGCIIRHVSPFVFSASWFYKTDPWTAERRCRRKISRSRSRSSKCRSAICLQLKPAPCLHHRSTSEGVRARVQPSWVGFSESSMCGPTTGSSGSGARKLRKLRREIWRTFSHQDHHHCDLSEALHRTRKILRQIEPRRTAHPPLLVATFVAASRSRGVHLARGRQVGSDLRSVS